MSDTFGPTSPRQFAFYDPDSSCWRTWPAISLWGSETYSGTWPKRGSMRSGACFEHPTWAPATSEHGCSSLLGTPTAMWKIRGDAMRRGRTPNPAEVAEMVTQGVPLLPTPVVNDMGEGKTPERWDEWTAEMQERHGNGNGHGKSLAIEAQRLLPTPTCDDASNVTRDSGEFQSLTRSVRKMLPTPTSSDAIGSRRESEMGGTRPSGAKRSISLMTALHHGRSHGVSTPPPSDATNEPSDDPPPHPPTTPAV